MSGHKKWNKAKKKPKKWDPKDYRTSRRRIESHIDSIKEQPLTVKPSSPAPGVDQKMIRYRGFVTWVDSKQVTEKFLRDFRHQADHWIERYGNRKVDTMNPTAAWQVGNKGTKFSKIGQTQFEVPPGEYQWEEDHNGVLWAEKQDTKTDNLLHLPDLPTDYILDQIQNFWDKKEQYDKYGFLQKRGVMLYGIPGCGKTSIIALLKRQLVDRGGVVFGMGEDGYSQLIDGLKQFREVEPERPIMTVVEDIETYLEGSNNSNVAQSEKDALALYDGQHQVNRVVHIATTNKPDLLADRFIKRPGRFDLVIGLHAPTRRCREAYTRAICKNQISEEQLNYILDGTKGLSLAYMREIVTTYLILEIPLEETVERLRKNAKQNFGDKEGFSVGFTGFEAEKKKDE